MTMEEAQPAVTPAVDQEREPDVTLTAPTGRVAAGTPKTVSLFLDRGAHVITIGPGETDTVPKATFTGVSLSIDEGPPFVVDNRTLSGSITENVTFPTRGDHTLRAFGITADRNYPSVAVNVHVVAGGPPTFTIGAPAAGSTVNLDESGAQVTVQVNFAAETFFPLRVRLDWDNQSQTFDNVTSPTFTQSIRIGATPVGSRSITVTCIDPDNQVSSQSVMFTGRDVATPHVAVTSPSDGSARVAPDANTQITVPIVGTATDIQSGMVGGGASVAWALSPTGTRTTVTPGAANDFRTWSATVPLTGFGTHTVYLWATDQAGNAMSAPFTVQYQVISSYLPATLMERLNERAYLGALLAFAGEQVLVKSATHLDTAGLVALLGQPLDAMSQQQSATGPGDQDVNELRVPVEVLRAFLTANGTSTTSGVSAEAAYRNAAYAALLTAAGTSYAELRLAKHAPDADRRALAARLGFRLSPTRPDELDTLMLEGATLDEPSLERVFGLPASNAADPLRVRQPPQLLTWQLAGQALGWADQDQNPSRPPAYAVIVDPDVVTAADIVAGPKGDPVRTLLTNRSALLSGLQLQLNLFGGARNALTVTLSERRVIPGVNLADLEAQDAQGIDISGTLAAHGLTRSAFLYLRQMEQLTVTSTMTETEWLDFTAVLVDAYKRQHYATWQGEETGIVLSPDFFTPGGSAPNVNPHRADQAARADWQATLGSRTTQRQALVDAAAQLVSTVEQRTLPQLRDALLTHLTADPVTGAAIAATGEAMTLRFQLDMLASGSLRTTRFGKAIEAVQALLIALRAGGLPNGHPATGWSLASPDAFGAAWNWLGEQSAWQAATTAFLFPERNLDPALVFSTSTAAAPSAALATLFNSIQGSQPFTAMDAVKAATTYLGSLPVALPAPGYLNPGRVASHQIAVRDAVSAKGAAANREITWVVPMLLAQRLQAAGEFQAALDWYWTVYPFDVSGPLTAYPSIYQVINAETVSAPDLAFPSGWTTLLDPFSLITGRPAPYTRYTLLRIIACHLDFADAEFARESDESVAHARALYVQALRLSSAAVLQPQTPTNPGEPPLPIPELASLRARATLQLTKLRKGLSLAGIPRRPVVSGTLTITQPTAYRFKTLMERARQLVAQATQMEAGYLAALEKYDDRNFRVFDALKGIDLSAAQVKVAATQIRAAQDGVGVAHAQLDKANATVSTLARAIQAPPNQYENALLQGYKDLREVRDGIAITDTAIGVMQAAANASNFFTEAVSGGATGVMMAGIIGATEVRGGLEVQQNNLEAQVQANQLQAGIEQRREEWRIQLGNAQQDVLVAAAQIATAQDQVTIAVQEANTASLQYDQAVATLKFLNDQFTNADLYLWMSTTLGGVYRYFLQQATAIARLTQAQLAFERAEPEQALVRNDYWQSPAELKAGPAQPDRRGLTGAEQLGQDLDRLDEYAFRSERRRLNLSQTVSLARLMPVEFLEFRRTGAMTFSTPMALFDADFPGHYLRLIRQVRTSLVALVPPDRGIRATLSSGGISRVTSGQNGVFNDVVLRHDPSIVALTSPVNASGVFELDSQSDMLLPFESSGVDTTWDLRLPPAANPFDYAGIADVLITIDYTALSDDGYRQQIIGQLNASRQRSADCVFSLARDFPDQWYDLHNPADRASRSVTIGLRDVDFPFGLSELSIGAVAVQLTSGSPVGPTGVTLTRGTAGGAATTTGGVVSTRRGNAAAWTPLIGLSPVGDWRISFGTDAATLFDEDTVDDVVLVVGWAGQAPAWTP